MLAPFKRGKSMRLPTRYNFSRRMLFVLELELAEGCWLNFKPGQFIQVKVPGTGKVRRYLMASLPETCRVLNC